LSHVPAVAGSSAPVRLFRPGPSALLITFAAALGALAPLYEMDLAHHLASGEWILRQRAVPHTEPFAWTRAGDPYYAYSWLAQIVFYAVLQKFGPLGLHLLEGLISAAVAAAAVWAGRELRWRPLVTLVVAALHLAVFWGLSYTLRPQQLLMLCVPLAWGWTERIRRAGITWPRLSALLLVASLAANTHLFFVITAAPVAYYLLAGAAPRRMAAAGTALVLGWLLSPYGFLWPQVFALNFGYNALLQGPPVINELISGFGYWPVSHGAFLSGMALLLLPFAFRGSTSKREQLAGVAMWTLGLAAFAFAGRLLVVWWALTFVLAGVAAEYVWAWLGGLTSNSRLRILVAAAIPLVPLLAGVPGVKPDYWRYEGDAVHRMLPRARAETALWLPSWLLCHTRAGANGRMFTEFNWGSELTWRLPGYSMSIDGRTIFPDSVALDFALADRVPARRATTWQSADLALISREFWLWSTLEQDASWTLLADARPAGKGAGLWARKNWWNEWGTNAASLPEREIYPGDARTQCERAGRFPRD
jgi:hypothetical protein